MLAEVKFKPGAITMERYAEQNVADVMTMGLTEIEARSMDSTERKELAATARRLMKSVTKTAELQKPRAFAAHA